jgi:hypothetical protein
MGARAGAALTRPRESCYRVVLPSGAVAQLGARVNGIHEVTGSIPVSSTKSSNNLRERR